VNPTYWLILLIIFLVLPFGITLMIAGIYLWLSGYELAGVILVAAPFLIREYRISTR
jgi:hypothetical protein